MCDLRGVNGRQGTYHRVFRNRAGCRNAFPLLACSWCAALRNQKQNLAFYPSTSVGVERVGFGSLVGLWLKQHGTEEQQCGSVRRREVRAMKPSPPFALLPSHSWPLPRFVVHTDTGSSKSQQKKKKKKTHRKIISTYAFNTLIA